MSWVQENTFSPNWLPGPLRRPLFGYVVAGVFELAAAVLMLLLTSLAPAFAFHGILVLVGLVLVAVGWGAGPGIFASLIGVLLLWLVVLPPHFTWRLSDPANGLGLVLAVLITVPISLIVGRSGRMSRRAEEMAQLLAQALARSHFDNELALSQTKTQMDTFLGIASHELKTPLTSLKLSLQAAQRQLRQLPQRKNGAATAGMEAGLRSVAEYLNRAAHQVQRLEVLVNDLLDVSRIQAGQLKLRHEPTDLVSIVREAVEAQQQAELGRSIYLQLPADLERMPVSADAGRIEQVVTNYLANALKYSAGNRPVAVGIEATSEQARVWVRDQGPGLPVEEQEKIWERFHRVEEVQVQSGAGVGLGLGLYIARTIVERHHGQVGVESTPGSGSTFWFTLPLSLPEREEH